MCYQSYEYCGTTYYQSNEYCGVCHKDETIVLDNCPICLENISQINRTTTPCGHTFHGSCIFDYIIAAYSCPTRMSLICPLCRTIAFNNAEDGCQRGCCRPDLEGFRTSEEEDEADKAEQEEADKAEQEEAQKAEQEEEERAYEEYINAYKNVPENVPENVPRNVPRNVYESYSDYDSNSDYDCDSHCGTNTDYDSDSDYDPENYQP